jgi:hypothetical protein
LNSSPVLIAGKPVDFAESTDGEDVLPQQGTHVVYTHWRYWRGCPDWATPESRAFWKPELQIPEPLYVGYTSAFSHRMQTHKAKAEWWRLIDAITFRPFLSKQKALEYEAYTIAAGPPPFNRAINTRLAMEFLRAETEERREKFLTGALG